MTMPLETIWKPADGGQTGLWLDTLDIIASDMLLRLLFFYDRFSNLEVAASALSIFNTGYQQLSNLRSFRGSSIHVSCLS